MSSCFLCDCSYKFTQGSDRYEVVYAENKTTIYSMKYMPIMVGSSGIQTDRLGHFVDLGTDQQHKDNNKQNYVSYRVKKIEFRASVTNNVVVSIGLPNYILIFKVPFREYIFDYHFGIMKNFMLYSEPESVLKYGVYSSRFFEIVDGVQTQKTSDKYDLFVDKPFIVGPNDYVGVLYVFKNSVSIDASARVWFDVV